MITVIAKKQLYVTALCEALSEFDAQPFKEENGFYPNVEVMIYGYYQAMIMKHCFINKARGYQNKRCDECKKDVYLTDRYGKSYPLMGDENCNLSVLYFKPVDLFDKVESLKSIGIYNYLIDFTVEKEDEVTSVLSSFSTEFKYFGHFINNDI